MRATIVAFAVAVGIALRWWPRPTLWLDEAQSVAFASLPVVEIPGALRSDGAPPLYYVVLHWWMELVGPSDAAVRALSALLSTATIAAVAVIVRRWWGTVPAVVGTLLIATSPFAIRYATHARMYSLVMLEVVLGTAAVAGALTAPSRRRLALVTLASGALLLTHYWSMYLVLTTVAVLLATSRAVPVAERRRRRRVAAAAAAGFLLWLPWLPTFLFQAQHTATPWAAPAQPAAILQIFATTVDGPSLVVVVLGIMVAGGFVLGLGCRSARTPSPAALGLVGAASAGVAVAGAMASSSAASSRYLSIAIPLVLFTAAAGISRCSVRWRDATVLAAAALGLGLARVEATTPRTTADDVADTILDVAEPGDVIVTCPDQLAPALHRIIDRTRPELAWAVFPRGSTAARVDWIDYADRSAAADPESMAARLTAATVDVRVWLVVSTTYPPTQPACAGLLRELRSVRPGQRLRADRPELDEHGALWRFDPG